MFSGLNKFIKYILPKRLFYRALIIVAAPTILLQLIVTIVFYDSIWIKANKNNLTEDAETISLGTKNSKTSLPDLILISTAFLNFEVLNQ